VDRAKLSIIVDRLAYLTRLREAVLSLYERTEDPRDRVRAGHLAADVAVVLDVSESPQFRRDITMAMRPVGWRSVMHDNRRLWHHVRRRDAAVAKIAG
jgi:hypothetical protein